MPTLPPERVKPPRDEAEKMARELALKFIEQLEISLYNYAYSTRTFMPGGSDFTNFTDGLNMIRKFCMERPDWTLDILMNAFEATPIKKEQNALSRFAYAWHNFNVRLKRWARRQGLVE